MWQYSDGNPVGLLGFWPAKGPTASIPKVHFLEPVKLKPKATVDSSIVAESQLPAAPPPR